jgi:hypothetical protein
VAFTSTKRGGFRMAEEDEEKARRDERERLEKLKQKWKEDDERWERLISGHSGAAEKSSGSAEA